LIKKKNKEKFIKNFKKLKFEEVFNENIREYIIKLVSKINNISTFGIVIKIIDIEKIKKNDKEKDKEKDKDKEYYDIEKIKEKEKDKDKEKEYYALLEDKYMIILLMI